jgi:heavy metal translocating P-type ATPase
MLSGGEALEALAVGRASSVLAALARRMPSVAHRARRDQVEDCPLIDIVVGDELLVFPHEICPVDGSVIAGHGWMDEAYLTGEPFRVPKAPGASVLSGAVNGDAALTIRAEKRAEDSRYAKIMTVMRETEQRRPRMRRLADQLGAWYTPLAVALALAAWSWSGDPRRFLGVLVVATPCPLLIAIPVAILGAVSLSAKRGIIVRDPAVLEMLRECRVAIFDKTGTLTYGRPVLTGTQALSGISPLEILQYAAALERYSRHPLALAITDAAQQISGQIPAADNVHEQPGQGIHGHVAGRSVRVTGRKNLLAESPDLVETLPAAIGGLECVVLLDDQPAGVLCFRDQPREDGRKFIDHLGSLHQFQRVMLLSGDRVSEVEFLAREVGIHEVFAEQSPEQKVELVRAVSQQAKTLFVGDGINDAPALAAATVGLAFGQNSDVTSEAARAVILDANLRRVDEFLHIGSRMRQIAIQSALGGIALSLLGMLAAAVGWLPPVAGAIFQELIDVAAVLNALRVAFLPPSLTDY